MDAGQPPYARIAAEIRASIAAGELRPGDRIPSTRQIAARWRVAKATAGRVIEELCRSGVVETVPRVGSVVVGPTVGVAGSTADSDPSRPRHRSGGVSHRTAAALDSDRVVAVALAIADAHGTSALTMRGIAHALEVPTMSLYRYVRDKTELLELMADAAFAEIDYPPVPPTAWCAHLELAARLHWQVYRRHPWLPGLISLTHPSLLPNLGRYAEWTLRAVRKSGLGAQSAATVHLMVANYVRGTATNLELHTEMRQRTGLGGGAWLAVQSRAAAARVHLDDLPAIAQAMRSDPGFQVDLDDLFEFGLARLLDGVAAFAWRDAQGGV